MQLPPTKVCPGGQPVQLVGVPTQVVQILSHAIQVEEFVRKALEMQLVQTKGESAVQARQFWPHLTQRVVVDSKAYPFMQPEQVVPVQ